MVSIPKKKWFLIIGILVGFGLVRMPVEQHLHKEMTKSGMILPIVDSNTVSGVRNTLLIATLGGLRPLVSTYFILVSYAHFENNEWDENRSALLNATYLQPRVESNWTDLVWHRGINAVAWVETRAQLPDFERRLLHKEYTLDAIELGKKGLEHNPDSVDIRLQMAQVYKVKMKDMCGAAQMYKEIKGLEGAPMYADRFYGYYLAECPGNEREAYEHLLKLYWEGKRNHLPTLIKKIVQLQETLDIPSPMWIPEDDPDEVGSRSRAKRKRKHQLPGGVSIP